MTLEKFAGKDFLIQYNDPMLSSPWKDYLVTIIISVLFALFIRGVIVTAYKVPTGSMQPSLKPGDFIFSYRLAYSFSQKLPERGDLVVFSYPQQPDTSYVKRVVGLPGDRVQITQGRLSVNESQLQYELEQPARPEDNPNPEAFDIYIERDLGHERRVIFQKNPDTQNFGPLVVPPGEVFVLGDNRDASDDSRYWGSVPMSQVHGRVLFIWLSLDWQKRWGADRYPSIRWNRVFTEVH